MRFIRALQRRAGPVLCLCLWAGAAVAHHSFAMFDQSKVISLQGVVTELQWTNPHAFLHVDVRDGKNVVKWQIELNSPNNLRRQGWNPTAIKSGDSITVHINPLRDGSTGGLFVSAMLADGTVLGDPTRGASGPINTPSAN